MFQFSQFLQGKQKIAVAFLLISVAGYMADYLFVIRENKADFGNEIGEKDDLEKAETILEFLFGKKKFAEKYKFMNIMFDNLKEFMEEELITNSIKTAAERIIEINPVENDDKILQSNELNTLITSLESTLPNHF